MPYKELFTTVVLEQVLVLHHVFVFSPAAILVTDEFYYLTAKTTNSIVKPTNSIANGTNSVAKPMDSIANGTNSIAKATNSIANGTNLIAKSLNSIAKTCNITITQDKGLPQ